MAKDLLLAVHRACLVLRSAMLHVDRGELSDGRYGGRCGLRSWLVVEHLLNGASLRFLGAGARVRQVEPSGGAVDARLAVTETNPAPIKPSFVFLADRHFVFTSASQRSIAERGNKTRRPSRRQGISPRVANS